MCDPGPIEGVGGEAGRFGRVDLFVKKNSDVSVSGAETLVQSRGVFWLSKKEESEGGRQKKTVTSHFQL